MPEWGWIPGMQVWLNIQKSIHEGFQNSHMIISIEAEKAFDKIQHPFINSNKLGIERDRLFLIKGIYEKLIEL